MHGVSDCPAADTLQRFLLGQFPSEEVERLAGHVESCACCADTLRALAAPDDLVQALQTPPLEAIPELEPLIARLCALRPPGYASDTNVLGDLLAQAGTPPPEDTQEIYDYLGPPLAAGELGRLGGYRVLRVLGIGGMGVVFLAEDPQLQRQLALKVLRSVLLTSASARRRFLREAQATAGLAHDHIIHVLHVGEERGVPFLAMPLLQGESLEARLQREHRLPIPEVLRIGREIAAGLAAAHQQGLIHRDIKPSNVWLEADTARVKILDFGLARLVAGEVALSQHGAIVGTPAYMAPEQARGEALDARCDLFSLGCVLYRLTTGVVPFQGATTMATLRALELEQPKPPHLLRPETPRSLGNLILQLLAKRPEERLPSAPAVAAALQAVPEGHAPQASPKPPWRRRTLAALVGVASLVGVWFTCFPELPEDKSPLRPGPRVRTASAQPCHFCLAVHYAVGRNPYAVAVGDFNGDGKLDLAVSNIGDNTVSVLLGNGDGSFRAAASLGTGAAPHGLVVGDFNGDGKADLAVANHKDNNVSVLLGNGDGTFRPAGRFATGAEPRGLAIGDFNGDGKPDLAVTDFKANSVTILLGQGDGTFLPGPRIRHDHLGSPISVAVADFNGDGRQDLVVANGGGNTVCLFLGNGDGTFRSSGPFAVGSGPGMVVVGDFNGDGHVDVAVENYGSNDVSVLLGNGAGTLEPAVSYPAGWGPGGLAVGDFNGDGIPDLVVANHDTHNLSFLLGKGDGTFRSAEHYAAGWTPAGVVVADFNGDGRADVVVVNHRSHNVSVLLNQAPRSRFRLSTKNEVTAGETFSVVLSALDGWNRPDSGYTGSVHFSSTDPRAELHKDNPFVPQNNGVLTRQLVFRTAGLQTLTVTDTVDGSRVGSIAVVVLPGPAAQFRLSAPEQIRLGQEFAVTVTPIDQHGNSAASYTGTVRFTGGGADAVLPGDYPFVPADANGHTFKGLILRTPGKHTLTITDRNNPKVSASTTITVSAGDKAR